MKLISLIITLLVIPSLVFGAAENHYITPAGAGSNNGTDWTNAWNYTNWKADVAGSAEAGDIYYVAGGNYTLTSDFTTALDGTAIAPIQIIGVKAGTTNTTVTAGDYAYGDDRPLITDGASAYTFTFDDYWILKNLKVTLSDIESIRLDLGGLVKNCYISNDGAATRYALNTANGVYNIIISNELISSNGKALLLPPYSKGLYNYIFDSLIGIELLTADYINMEFNIIDTCPIGIQSGNGSVANSITHNTIYNDNKADSGSIGINTGTGDYSYTVSHNIITGFETGINFGDTSSNTGYFDYNDIYDCGTDRVNVTAGINDVDIDPQFTDAANGDFDIGANLDDLGLDQPGDLSSSHLEIGAVMYEETPGTGGSCSDVFGFIE